jgi:heme ABC exporter ATP-binding subunit CcmA
LAIQARGLSKEFGNRWVLRGVDLEVDAGECIALTGANGSGKTTLLRCLASLTRPTQGEVRWFGRSAAGGPADRRLIGMVAHETWLYPQLSLRENLIFAARMCGLRQAAVRADRLLDTMGLTPNSASLPGQVSQGMRQRVAVARAIAHQPRILLLDEPFAGLDAQGIHWLTDLMTDQGGAGTTICFTTHDRATAVQLAGRRFELRAGRLCEPETPQGMRGTLAPKWARAA